MRVAYILHRTSPTDGSTKAFISMLCHLTKMGIEPVLVLPDKKGIYMSMVQKGYPILVSTFRPQTYPRTDSLKNVVLFFPHLAARIICNWITSRRIVRFLKETPVELIHSNVSVVGVGFHAAQRLGIPHIFHIREYANLIGQIFYPQNGAFTRMLSAKSNYTVCITKDIQKHYHLNGKDSSRVVYDGISNNIGTTIQEKDPKEKRFFLYAGRLEPIKGLLDLLHAYAIYVKATTEVLPLFVAGKATIPSFFKEIQTFIHQHQLEEHVTLLGEVDNLATWMRKATATIIPSRFEGFGLCMPEAMGCGCLTIGRNVNGIKEQMDNGRKLEGDEIALRYDDEEQLVCRLKEVTDCPQETFDPIRQRAFHTVNTLYAPERNAQEVKAFYHTILQEIPAHT